MKIWYKCLETSSKLKTLGCANTLRPRQNGCHYPDKIFKCAFLNENGWISIWISLNFVPKVQIDNIPSIGSYNGLVPKRHQWCPILLVHIWTNDVLFYWCIYASQGLNELKGSWSIHNMCYPIIDLVMTSNICCYGWFYCVHRDIDVAVEVLVLCIYVTQNWL